MASRPLTLFLFIPLLVLHAPVLGIKDSKVGITIHPDSVSVVAERKAAFVLNCSVSTGQEYAPLNFTWFKNGKVVEENRKVNILRNGSLYFKRIVHKKHKSVRSPDKRQGRTDSGWYECYATNKIGTIFVRRVHLEVADVGKKFVSRPASQTVPEGGVARFHCHIDGVKDANYVWEKDGQTVSLSGQRFKKFSGVLQIQDLKLSDAGSYKCIYIQRAVTNIEMSTQSELIVKGVMGREPARIVAGPANITVNINSQKSVILECLAEGNPKPEIKWSRKDKVPIVGATETPLGNLEIQSVNAHHGGMYVCTAKNSLGSDSKSGYLDVIVPPVITTRPSSGTVASLYALDISFYCDANGKPTPSLRWLKDGKELQDGSRIRIYYDGRLLVRETELSDSGYYQCIVNNSAGYATLVSRAEIRKAEGSPTSPPVDVRVSVVSETDVRITWHPSGPARSEKTWYTITRNIVDEDYSGKDWYNTDLSQETSVTVQDLEPYTNFSFHVRTWNSKGASPASPVVYAKTMESVPITYPRIVDLKSPTPTSILVTWKHLTPQEARGKVKNYVVYYKSGSTMKDALVSPEKNSYTIRNLKPDTSFLIRVLGQTAKGFPEVDKLTSTWPWKEQRTQREPVISGNLKIEVTRLNTTTVIATWSIGVAEEDITGFTLIVETTVGSEQFGPFQIPPSENSYVLTDLKNNTYYEVTLEAFGKGGISWTDTRTIATSSPVDLPPPPLELDGEARSPISVDVKWKPPQTTLVIESYTINYTVANSHGKPDLSTSKVMQSKSTSIVISGLKPFTNYRISVQSRMHNSGGEFSNPIFVTTSEDVPLAPESLDWTMKAPTEIRVSWKPPHQQNGQIILYEIFYISQLKNNGKKDWTVVKQNGSATSQDLTGLDEKIYLLKVRAWTNKGAGNFSSVVTVDIPGRVPVSPNPPSAPASKDEEFPSSKVVLIAGLVVAVVIIVISVVVIVKRRGFSTCCGHPSSGSNRRPPSCPGNGSLIHAHSNGRAGHAPHDAAEMKQYCNMLPTLPEHDKGFVDAKGGGTLVLHAGVNGISLPKECHNGHMHHNSRHIAEEETRAREPLLKSCKEGDAGPKGGPLSRDRAIGDSLENIDHGDTDLSQHGDVDMDDSSTPLVSKPAREGLKLSRGNATTPPSDGGALLRKGANCVTNPSAVPPGNSTASNQGSVVPTDSGPSGAGGEAESEEDPVGGAVSTASGQLSGSSEDKPNLPLSQHQSNQTSHYTPRGGTGGGSAPPLAPPPLAGSSSSPPSDVTFTSASIPHGAPTNAMAADQIHSLQQQQHTGHLSDSMFSQRLPVAESTAAQEGLSSPPEDSSHSGSEAAVVDDDVQLSLKPNDLTTPLAAMLDGTAAADHSRQTSA